MTREQWQKMSDDEKNIKIAELSKWCFNSNGSPCGHNKITGCFPSRNIACIPDYLSNLNAMHEAEKILTPVQKTQYLDCLLRICLYDPDDEMLKYNPTFATAEQRAEAFVMTMEP